MTYLACQYESTSIKRLHAVTVMAFPVVLSDRAHHAPRVSGSLVRVEQFALRLVCSRDWIIHKTLSNQFAADPAFILKICL